MKRDADVESCFLTQVTAGDSIVPVVACAKNRGCTMYFANRDPKQCPGGCLLCHGSGTGPVGIADSNWEFPKNRGPNVDPQ